MFNQEVNDMFDFAPELPAMAMIGVLLFATLPAGAAVTASDDAKASVQASRGSVRLRGFRDPEMDFQVIRSIGADAYGGGTIGEILAARDSIADGDPSAWTGAFAALAERLEADGKDRMLRGHPVSARDAFLPASSYWRAAEYYGDPRRDDAQRCGLRCREAFLAGTRLLPGGVEDLRIPFGDTPIRGYFLRAASDDVVRPTVLMMSGYDGTSEEMFFAAGRAGLERGYNVLLFDSPGQTGMRRFFPDSAFIPDYGPVIRAVIDHAMSRTDVDPKRIALYGVSMGGYLALSGSIGEGRLAALVLNSPITNLHEYMSAFMSRSRDSRDDMTLDELAALPDDVIPWGLRSAGMNFIRRFGATTFSGAMKALEAFDNRPRLKRLKIPTLALASRGEGAAPVRLAEEFAATSPRPVTLRIFEQSSGANMHCQLDNLPLSAAVIFDWLDETLR